MPFILITKSEVCKETVKMRIQNRTGDLSYQNAIARFDNLWQLEKLTESAEQNEKEMRGLIALIEYYEGDQTIRTQHSLRDDKHSIRSGHYQKPETHFKGESP